MARGPLEPKRDCRSGPRNETNGKRSTAAAAAGLVDSAVTVAATLNKLDTWFLADMASLGVTLAAPKPTSAGAGAIDSPTGFAVAKYLGAFDPAATTL